MNLGQASVSGLALARSGGHEGPRLLYEGAETAEPGRPFVYGGMRAFHDRVKTGSHIETNGVALALGLGWASENSAGRTLLGLYFEGGRGDYDAYKRWAGTEHRGDGDSDYYGLGLALRHDFASGFHLDGSLRAGRVSTDFSDSVLGLQGKFESDSNYYGGHFGLGQIFEINESNSVDLYGQVTWTRQSGDTVRTAAGLPYHYDSADSVYSRLGARWTGQVSSQAAVYAGAAWEHEFDGEVVNSLNSISLPSAKLEGDSAFLELGLSLSPAESAWTVDLAIQGNVGDREGYGGRVMFGKAF
ncbi:autotransporter outer membrane beta-barrel domain-containing protein [Deltaproteobacteria bacterium OttesenSCG-928-M10]|nr:autotransporter outer membrane beta-barrel domain-containing protein [Deltaproteobacteria bacterium OttesenSCG-928-M10]